MKGKYSGYMECHIEPDWLLIWKADSKNVYLTRTGTHSDLFG
ncbi:MAG: type II toxin-antitoxin system YafQ family toxin [Desulfobacterales bacterium]|uniref:Type II toxin-antitoxin system YafQ family toxin n=1 Tax=Candidatus Desulfaltia bathyphila TaxID=2841697 RepID=A0A8J6N4U4_9BACT|nr:type II toxin-antitoxin system YafQ family toxin [Candidatus Desulfaltia bathyphila]MBL7195887.1 type II toxin-antitoxin system YafQ family toxin [Desulfobacterales bacterium]MBL7207246.1 type II toxin-antitoxin system YafQ family toxin [Desulfobacterales bacterium]